MLKCLPLAAALAVCLLLSSGPPARADAIGGPANNALTYLSDGYYWAFDNYVDNPTDVAYSAYSNAYYAQYNAAQGFYYHAYYYGYYAYLYASQSYAQGGGTEAYSAQFYLYYGYTAAYDAWQQGAG
jgi:hypothetical protein